MLPIGSKYSISLFLTTQDIKDETAYSFLLLIFLQQFVC